VTVLDPAVPRVARPTAGAPPAPWSPRAPWLRV